MMHPFLNTKGLTDDQLLEKIQKCQAARSYQLSLGHGDTVDSIDQVLDSLVMEQQNRLSNAIEEEIKKKNPDQHNSLDVGYCDDDPTSKL